MRNRVALLMRSKGSVFVLIMALLGLVGSWLAANYYVRQVANVAIQAAFTNVASVIQLTASPQDGGLTASRVIWDLTVGLNIAMVLAAAAIIFAVQRTRALNIERQRNVTVSERHALMRKFADMATDSIAILDGDLRFLYVNQVLARAHGVPFISLLGHRFGERAVAEDKNLIAKSIESLKKSAGAKRLIWRMRMADGSVCWWETEIVGFETDDHEDAKHLRYISISRDFTARKRAEASLVEAHENISAMLRESRGILFRDSFRPQVPMLLRLVVGSLSSIGGLDSAESGRPGFLVENLDDESRLCLQELREKCLAEGHAAAELHYQGGGDDMQWLRVQSTRLGETAEDVELLHLFTDITAEHSQRQIQQQTERLAVIGEVCSGIAHEVNQPLAVIALAASNALRELGRFSGNGDRIAAKLHRIEEQAVRAGKIVSHIRGFGRIELANREVFTVGELIETAIMLAQSRLNGAGVHVSIDVAPYVPDIFSVRLVLEQVLMNLLVNACDAYADNPATRDLYSPLRVVISAEALGDGCMIRVADEAGGIPAYLIDRVFTPFFTTKAADKGTGLGLSFCATSVRELGGRISVHNDHGGAVFEVELPAEVCVGSLSLSV